MKKIALLSIATIFSLFAFPKMNFGQAPVLGTAADFVLFSSVGAVSNVGISHLTGHVGTNSGSSTGFGNVNGVMHDGDVASAQCAVDLLIAYNQLDATVPTFFPAPLLGNGQILIPGVYSIPSPATLNLDLTLDGLGDPNALFIFQIEGAFSTNAAAKVYLINGTKACNVFWKVEGLVSMATETSMKGTIVANNAGIDMNVGDTLEGRALSTTGAITINGTLAYTPIGCGSPVLMGPGAPALASLGCYALFSSDGPVTNVGVTNVTGDIGTNNGSTTGYNPLLVVGAIHPVPDGSTAAAAPDLLNVYNYLNTLPYDIELLYPVQFGNNLVLTPHTYRMNAAATFTDTLYLDAQGSSSAVFVIQINGALSTSTYSRVVLINGALSENVFWKVEGAVSINDYSIFRGTIVCNNGAINLNTGVTLDGRALTTTGALATSAITAIIPPGCGSIVPPSIITEPTDQMACSGGSVSFTVTATGGGLMYQWRKGSVDLVDGGNISGATTATLTINPVTIADTAYNYNVIVSGSSTPNDTSVNVSLMMTIPTTIIAEPMDQILCTGDSAGFTVSATGTGLTYQWRKGIVNLIDGGNISGSTTAILNVDPATILDAATDYNVIVVGGCTPNDTSVNASLIITTAPVILSEPLDRIVCAGDSVSFTVSSAGTGLTYQWRRGTVNLIDGGNISGATSSILIIDPVSVLDTAYNYNVIVTGGCAPNDTSINVSLIVNTAPAIVLEPSDQTVCSGGTAGFSISATGSGITYQWRKGSVNLVDGGNISGASSAVLTINPVTILDAATNYNVIVTGICSPNDTSVNVSLTINTSPVIVLGPTDQTVCSGSSASFNVTGTGSGLTYQWRKGALNLVNGGNISGATSSILTINPTSISDAAVDYNVVITGSCTPNDTSMNASLTVNPTPIASASVNSAACAGGSIDLTAVTVPGGTYSWTSTTGYTSMVQNPTIFPVSASDAGTYFLTVTVGGCTSTPSSVVITVNNCIADLSVVKTVNKIYPVIGQTVVFTIIVTNNGPNDASGVEVTDVLQSGYAYISSIASSGVYLPSTGVWTIGNMNSGASEVLTITATVINEGNYVNTAIVYGTSVDPDMSNNTSTVETYPTDFFIPEGFSPNGDGINDLFVIRGIQNYTENTFMIFNRWGNKVFDASPYQNTWDGRSTMGLRIGGDELPIGTYFYILDLGDGSEVIKGTIYLNR